MTVLTHVRAKSTVFGPNEANEFSENDEVRGDEKSRGENCCGYSGGRFYHVFYLKLWR